MSFTLYDAAVKEGQRALVSLNGILKTAEAASNSASFPAARIHPDMLPLGFQVHIVTDCAHKLVSKVTGAEAPKLESELKSFQEFYAHIEQAQAALAGLSQDALDSNSAKTVSVGFGPRGNADMPLHAYVTGYYLPNVFFHLSTAYNILRKEGVELGKANYLGAFLAGYGPK